MCCICGGGDSYVVVYGCTDSNATNYNPDANTDDGLCEFALVQGCTDASACNYDPSAEQDNGSCVSAEPGFDCNGDCLSGTLLTMSDTYGDGWGYASLVINGESYAFADGDEAKVCVDLLACNIISWSPGGFYDDLEASWTLGDISSGSGYLQDGLGAFGECDIPGCIDESACNYDSNATSDNGSCTYAESGFGCNGSPLDCAGQQTNDYVMTYVGDGYCDDGAYDYYFDCEAHNYDNGDCGHCADETALNYGELSSDGIPNCEYPATCDYAVSLSGSDSSNTGDMVGSHLIWLRLVLPT